MGQTVPLRCRDYAGHLWEPILRTDVKRSYMCTRCTLVAYGIAVFGDGIRAAHIAKKYGIGKYYEHRT